MNKIINHKGKIVLIFSLIIVFGLVFAVYFFQQSSLKVPVEPKLISETLVPDPIIVPKTEVSTPTKAELVAIPEPKPLPLGIDRFIVSLKDTNDIIADNLLNSEYIKDKDSFIKLITGNDGKGVINPGAYKISKEMTPHQLVQVLKGKAYMVWIKIPEGLRKEEIAQLLAKALGWTAKQKNNWISVDTATKPEYMEGVYFPETYLIPIDETPSAVASRLISKFNEKFAPYLAQFTAKNIKWTTALTMASIVQREAANDADTSLIAGILWNRLNQNMQLGVDATLQYLRGDKGAGWWAPVTVLDKKTDSPFNTYIHTGLPPRPISNPGLPAIMAVLNPTQTDCLYYLHDKNRITHCAVTYEEHQANILKYLK